MLQDVQKALQFFRQLSSHQCYRMFRKHFSFSLSVVIPPMVQDAQKALQFCPVSRHPTSAPCPHLIITTPRLFLSLHRHSNRRGVVSTTPKVTFIIRSQISSNKNISSVWILAVSLETPLLQPWSIPGLIALPWRPTTGCAVNPRLEPRRTACRHVGHRDNWQTTREQTFNSEHTI